MQNNLQDIIVAAECLGSKVRGYNENVRIVCLKAQELMKDFKSYLLVWNQSSSTQHGPGIDHTSDRLFCNMDHCIF